MLHEMISDGIKLNISLFSNLNHNVNGHLHTAVLLT
jgi:hypothetical protein